MNKWLKPLRRALAFLSLAALTLLFLDFTGALRHWFGWLAEVQFLPAVLALNAAAVLGVLVLTLFVGRIYCSVICPLGVFQDAVAWLRKRVGRVRYTYSKGKTALRGVFFLVLLALILCGFTGLAGFLAPYSTFGRFVTSLLQPLYIMLNNVLAGWAENADSYLFYHHDYHWMPLALLVPIALHLIIICIMAWRGGRTWCNTVCPVGSVLGAVARFSLLQVILDKDKCHKCGKCVHKCKASCIDIENGKIDHSRCVMCGNCLTECKFGGLNLAQSLRHKKAKTGSITSTSSKISTNSTSSSSPNAPADPSRRAFLVGSAAAISATALAEAKIKLDGGLAAIEDKVAPKRQTPLVPAGAISLQHLTQHCTACQLCVSECPNGVLRPSTDPERFMQPEMSYENGYCRPECTRCADVCPTNAIIKIEKADKSAIQIGHAVWIKKNCVVLTDDVQCGNCARHCPAGAIEMVPSDPDNPQSKRIPAVNEAACIGCGACENLCPARPLSAIMVEGHERHSQI